ncbi:MAG: hypothetical protein BWY75_03204 [bacterium ADurb.Bin425]|nr:MAG: hypothetical protein BWY75_03204 [bacterium ADurb.Bin425]
MNRLQMIGVMSQGAVEAGKGFVELFQVEMCHALKVVKVSQNDVEAFFLGGGSKCQRMTGWIAHPITCANIEAGIRFQILDFLVE